VDVLRILLLCLFVFSLSYGKESRKPEEVLKEMFPGSEVEVRNFILTKEDQRRVEKLSGVKIGSRFVSFYVVKKEGKVLAYAYVDAHRVRTHPEVVLYVLGPDGRIKLIEILAFYEPAEYRPPESWLKLFINRSPENLPRYRKDIPNITGATLTARAITKHTRKVLVLWELLFGGRQ